MTDVAIILVLAYLIGSLSPGYFFGRVVKGVDIRKFGNHNTGATNTYHVVGPVYGFVTVVFDFLKAGVVYVLLALNWGIDPSWAILFGLAVVVGHNWSFYLQFRGGRGAASLSGLVVAVAILNQTWPAVLFVALSIAYLLVISKKLAGMWSVRKTLKLSALLLPFGFIEISSGFFLAFTAILLVVAIVFDIVRLNSARFNKKYITLGQFAKEKEKRLLSGYTLFLLSALVLFLFFPKDIVLVSLAFFIFADLVAPIGGALFLKKEISHRKTWGGAVSIVAACLFAGSFMVKLSSAGINWNLVVAASVIVAVLDQFSFVLDDNLLVPLGTASILLLVF